MRAPTARNIQHISKEEICAAMMIILNHCVGTTREALISETVHAFGFMRQGINIQKAMKEAIDYLINAKCIVEIDDKLKCYIKEQN